jgi:hypothetical protein
VPNVVNFLKTKIVDYSNNSDELTGAINNLIFNFFGFSSEVEIKLYNFYFERNPSVRKTIYKAKIEV